MSDIGDALTRLIAQPGTERELSIGPECQVVPRIAIGLPLIPDAESGGGASELFFPRLGLLENFQWVAKERQEPDEFEIEIEVHATGLNFRDVMLAMGLLNDDVLDEGWQVQSTVWSARDKSLLPAKK